MTDRKQVIFDIERCICHVPDACRDCSRNSKSRVNVYCMEDLMRDALALLKEQEAREQCLKPKCIICPHCDNCDVDENGLLKKQEAIPADTKVIGTFNGDVKVYCCRNCRMVLDPWFHYCPNCGKAVKWE